VDRVLHGRGNVKADIAERVHRIARDHDYQTNPFASALVKGQRLRTVGVVMNSRDNRFFDDVLQGIEEATARYAKYGLALRIHQLKGYDEAEQAEAIERFAKEAVDLLAITPINTPRIQAALSALTEQSGTPVVTLNNDLPLDGKLAFVGCDYLNSGRVCGDIARLMLPAGGAARIGIITGSSLVLGHGERILGFREVIGMEEGAAVVSVAENNDDNETSYEVTKRLLAEQRPDLLYFCAAGTEGGVRAVRESGLPVKVIVVDDIPPMRICLAEGMIHAIVTQQPRLQGERMVEIAFDWLFHARRPAVCQNHMDNVVVLPHML
ncbi:MAG: LacI family DNA-binding transcriptional regulator, partial [Clostridiales Family XIII bacterium]|nr:LacI family DNA-binding transcriptional regulator [Clostridiales Family XIII bacterium]